MSSLVSYLCFIMPVMVVVVRVFDAVLNLGRFASFREALRTYPHRWLGYAIPFSPALSVFMYKAGQQFLPFAIPPLGMALSVLFTSVFSAAAGACWLSIPDDPTHRIRIGYAQALGIVLWVLDSMAFGAILVMLR